MWPSGPGSVCSAHLRGSSTCGASQASVPACGHTVSAAGTDHVCLPVIMDGRWGCLCPSRLLRVTLLWTPCAASLGGLFQFFGGTPRRSSAGFHGHYAERFEDLPDCLYSGRTMSHSAVPLEWLQRWDLDTWWFPLKVRAGHLGVQSPSRSWLSLGVRVKALITVIGPAGRVLVTLMPSPPPSLAIPSHPTDVLRG